MTTTPGLEWLTVGATVAYIANRVRQSPRVFPAHVDKVGKRDVVVTASGGTEKFNINHTEQTGDNIWLVRSGGTYTWQPSTYLAPVDDPAVAEMAAQQKIDRAAERVIKSAAAFGESRDAASARQLRDTIYAFLALADNQAGAE